MPRLDLIQLSADDLAALTNRGTVKRAQKEVEGTEYQVQFEEGPEDRLLAKWSDGITCEFHAGKSIHEATCSSGALGISRYIVRSILAYQKSSSNASSAAVTSDLVAPVLEVKEDSTTLQKTAADRPEPTDSTIVSSQASTSHASEVANDSVAEPAQELEEKKLGTWDPGKITDDQLIERFGKAAIQKARTRFASGTLVELGRGAKPYAIFMDEKCYVLFMVQGDLRYVRADCSEAQLPKFVAMAVWAFRELPQDQTSATLAIQQSTLPVPPECLDGIEQILDDVLRTGLSNSLESFIARLSRLDPLLRMQGLSWPAELAATWLTQLERYQQRDALFDMEEVVWVIGELIARVRAIRSDTGAVPQLLIRGTKFDVPTDISSSRYTGIGMEVRAGKSHTLVYVYFQDVDTGLVAAIKRSFSNAPPEDHGVLQRTPLPFELKSYSQLAGSSFTRSLRLTSLAGSQLLLKSGKRSPGGELTLPRRSTSFSSNPQSFRWEQLKPPLLSENWGQLISRLETLPPSYLRPVRYMDGLCVVPLQGIEDVQFDPIHQQLTATLRDENGDIGKLSLPFESRNNEGFTQFVQRIASPNGKPIFIAGRVRLVGRQANLYPLAVVFECDGRRYALNPYRNEPEEQNGGEEEHDEKPPEAKEAQSTGDENNSISSFFQSLIDFHSDALMIGFKSPLDSWLLKVDRLYAEASATGFPRIAEWFARLREECILCQNDPHHSLDDARSILKNLIMFSRIAST